MIQPGEKIEIRELYCWHANELIYQADGVAVDGRAVYVRYRRPWFGVGIGATPDEAAGADTFVTDAHPDVSPRTITRAVLESWSGHLFRWPERIDGFHNEPECPRPGDGPDRMERMHLRW